MTFNPEDNPEEGDLDNEAEMPQEPPKYEEIATEVAERPVNIEDYSAPKSITEEEEETPQKTDIQAILGSLTPKFRNKRINELAQSAMVSRIFPDNYTDKHFLITASLIEECDPHEDIDVVGIISQVQDALSIGFEGRGIVDRLEIAGVAHEQEMEKLSKELGL
jgi:hypothetical protein